MFRRVARLRRMAAGTSESFEFISTTSAASMATSVPAPMAMPVSARVRRSVVDAVTHHGHLAAGLQLADDGLLAVGQDARDDLVHARLPADGVGGALVVTGEHHDPDAHVL